MFGFIPPHEHFSYHLRNMHLGGGECWSNPFLLYKPGQHIATRAACPMEHPSLCFRTKKEQTPCNTSALFKPAFQQAVSEKSRLQTLFLQGPLLSLKHWWGMLSLAHWRADLETQQTQTHWGALALTSSSRCAATAWPCCDVSQLML